MQGLAETETTVPYKASAGRTGKMFSKKLLSYGGNQVKRMFFQKTVFVCTLLDKKFHVNFEILIFCYLRNKRLCHALLQIHTCIYFSTNAMHLPHVKEQHFKKVSGSHLAGSLDRFPGWAQNSPWRFIWHTVCYGHSSLTSDSEAIMYDNLSGQSLSQ